MKYLLIIIGLIYILSPYDIIPDFMVGWGWLDDLILLFFLWRFVKNLLQQQSNARNFYHRHHQSFGENNGFSENDAKGPAPSHSNDPYTVLNVPRNASPEEIKTAYRKLVNKYHPDKVFHLGKEFRDLAEKRFKEIEEAYRKLMPK
jgi:DnaJ like chaperone protein